MKIKIHPLLRRVSALAATAGILLAASPGAAQLLGTAGTYGVLGASTVTNTGNTVITGNLGLSPGTAITGFNAIDSGPGLFTGTANIANALAGQAQLDALTAYNTLAGLSSSFDLTGQDLGGLTLTPGVYHFDTSAQLTGALTLNALGDSNARFVFQVGSTLTTASNSLVNIINLGTECGPDNGLYWQIGSSATIGTDTLFAGNILAYASVTLNTGASIDDGRAIALMGAVTLDNNRIDASNIDGGFCQELTPDITPVPEASTYGLIGSAVLMLAVWRRRGRGFRVRAPA